MICDCVLPERPSISLKRILTVSLTFMAILAVAGIGGWKWHQVHRRDEIDRLGKACRTAFAAKEWTELEQNARKWLAWDPLAADALLYLGECRIQQHDPEGAVQALLTIPDSSRKSHPALLIATDLLLGTLNRPDEGVAALKRLIRLKPNSTAARQRLIYFYGVTLQREQFLQAITEAMHAQAEPPEAYVYLMIADHITFSNGFEQAEKWLKSDPTSETLRIARLLQLLDRIDTADSPAPDALKTNAEKQFADLVREFPRNMALYRYRLERAARDFDLPEMESLLAAVPPGADEDSIVWRHRGWYQLQTNHGDDAERSLRQSLNLFPLDWHTWNDLANALRRQGKTEEAEQVAKTALEGKELRKELVQLPNANDLSVPHLLKIGRYADLVGATDVAEQIRLRIGVMGQAPGTQGGL